MIVLGDGTKARQQETLEAMALTRDFSATTKARAERDPRFRCSLFHEAAQALLDGDLAVCKGLLHDLVNAMMGFAGAAQATGLPAKSLMRMLGPAGNPRAENLTALLAALSMGVEVRVAPASRTAARRTSTP